jgi:hypothetical protein
LLALRQGCKRGVKLMPSLRPGPHVSLRLGVTVTQEPCELGGPRFDIEPLAASTLSVPHHPPKPPQPTYAPGNRHHVLHHRSLGLPRRAPIPARPIPGRSWTPPMGHCPGRGGARIWQAGAQDWREEGPRALCMSRTDALWRVNCELIGDNRSSWLS